MLQEQELEAYRKAGKLLAEVREKIKPMVRVGESLVRIAEEAERLIQEKGAKPAFPCNVSLNEVAAHYSPPADDPTVIKEGDLVKVDLGAHLDGYIADTAFTIATDEEGERLKEAAEKALEAAIATVKPGVDVGEVGRAIEEAAKGAGFKPIANLTGHALSRWTLHGGLTIPNLSGRTGQRLE
ncbi:MAG: type II methionyl aminopeptidase, partial [Hadesarchaea archaeon]